MQVGSHSGAPSPCCIEDATPIFWREHHEKRAAFFQPPAARLGGRLTGQKDLAAALAEEVRVAVAETASPRPSARENPVSLSPLEDIGKPLERAEAHLTPVIPAGAPLSGVKRLALRAARFLWRDQTSFNALALEAMIGLRHSAQEARGALESLAIQLADFRRENEEWRRDARARQDAFEAAAKRRAAIVDGRLARQESAGPAPVALSGSAPGESARPDEDLPPGVYNLFEERFRGSPEEVAGRQKMYLSFLHELRGPVLDVGSGRGEFLRLLRSAGIPARGIEVNPLSAQASRGDGLDVVAGDAFDVLAGTATGSCGAVVAFQVVEHWSAAATYRFLREARRVLVPGGVLIAETINTNSLSALRAFFLDPTHVRPVPPEALEFLAEAAGFADPRIVYSAPVEDAERLEETSANDAKLNRLLFDPQDYALLARAPEGAA